MKPSQKSPGSIQSISSILLHLESFSPETKDHMQCYFHLKDKLGCGELQNLCWSILGCHKEMSVFLVLLKSCNELFPSSSCQCPLNRSFLSYRKHIFSEASFGLPSHYHIILFYFFTLLISGISCSFTRIHMKVETSSNSVSLHSINICDNKNIFPLI